MTRKAGHHDDTEPDIVALIMALAKASGLDCAQADLIERHVRETYGTRRLYIPKRRKHKTDEERARIYQAGLTNATTEELTHDFDISRATLNRIMKAG